MIRGHHVFHSGYFSVSRRVVKTREAGADIVVDAERVRIALPRGVVGVQRPSGGGQVGMVMVEVGEGGLETRELRSAR